MSKRVILDLDIVCFSAACAAEKRFYLFRGQKHAYKEDVYKQAYGRTVVSKEEREQVNEEVEILVEAEPAAHARQNCRMLLQNLLDVCAPVSSYVGYITGAGNFRYELATLQPYKGNRDSTTRPVHLEAVQEFLVEECNGEIVEGIEADDKIAVEYCKDPKGSVLCSQDKDFKQLAHLTMWNWKAKEWVTVTPFEASYNFYTQVLVGDQTDNIGGVKGLGKQRAAKILSGLKDDRSMAQACYNEYRKVSKKPWEDFIENARLLYLCRTEEDLLDPVNAYKSPITP